MHQLSPARVTRSYANLQGVRPELIFIIVEAYSSLAAMHDNDLTFIITEGLRTPQRQAMLVKNGASRTLNSRHLTGHAFDIAAVLDGRVSWDWPLYSKLADVIKESAALLSIPIVWGGDWKSFRDGPHFELDRKHFP